MAELYIRRHAEGLGKNDNVIGSQLLRVIPFVVIVFLLSPLPALAQELNTVSTFHSIGLTWDPPDASASRTAYVQYRREGESAWREGYPLWYSEADDIYRGSLVHLMPGTEYEIQLTLEDSEAAAFVSARTWSETFPVGRTIELPELTTESLTLDESGTPEGYILYTHAPGQTATIDGQGEDEYNILVNASYVIIRGLTLKDAAENGIRLGSGAHDVVIEGNDISGWGQIAYEGTQFGETDGAIHSNTNTSIRRIIIQRNAIHHPRADSNSWGEPREDISEGDAGTHPGGPQAIYMFESGGNHVIRYNSIYSDDAHRFNDCIGGGENFGFEGFPNRDSDIYGNYMEKCWDNGIESEGGNRNVRIWGNYVTETYRPIANRDTNVGPLYIWRNVVSTSRRFPDDLYDSDEDPRGTLQKAGGEEGGDQGVHVFHNTALQPTGRPDLAFPLGVSGGLEGPMQDTTTRNNILHVHCDDCMAIDVDDGAETNDFDYDLYNGLLEIPGTGEPNGIQGVPIYASGHGFDASSLQGSFELAAASPGYDAGEVLPNFNSEHVTGAGPDVGAHEAGMPPMQFGTEAYLSYGESYAQKVVKAFGMM